MTTDYSVRLIMIKGMSDQQGIVTPKRLTPPLKCPRACTCHTLNLYSLRDLRDWSLFAISTFDVLDILAGEENSSTIKASKSLF